ncbi:hypothetical protein SRABI91_04496 [Rhodococcoides fascians]|jgi:hypothetical protein|nr:hypothetical protein SRABI91_04496 [Rhodococcus fascians]
MTDATIDTVQRDHPVSNQSSTYLDDWAEKGSPMPEPSITTDAALSPAADYLVWCTDVGADPFDVEALQEWDYLRADEMTEAEQRTMTAWAVRLDLYSAA